MPPRLIKAVLWLGDVHRRVLAAALAGMGPRAAYGLTELLARLLYALLLPLKVRSEGQLRAALGGQLSDAQVRRIAARSFVHRVWQLTDLLLAERLLHAGTYARYGGRIPEANRQELLAAQRRGQPAILLTAYYGPFDLLPVFLGFNGVHAAAVYRRHENAAFDILRRRVRARSGCELIPVEDARERLPALLESGQTVAIVADHHVERRAVPATFLGLPTGALRTVGLLAWRYDADIVVAGIRRRPRRAFQFEIEVTEVIKAAAWRGVDDPVTYITHRYLRALERLVLRDPAQYTWAYARWGRMRNSEFGTENSDSRHSTSDTEV